ncbi:MAG: SpoIIE family protein phosphatase [Acaryochloridaceae cyanobacterium SU_2_1]|nr:SpoIIE family protein phosphatase [Acaryochloridaceae cyanobacterium SU_2_1]
MLKILVIDDDLVTQFLLSQTLKNQGYRVTVAGNGEEGILKSQEIEPALIICDWMMPGLDGLEVCRRIKALPALATSYFILLTSRTAINDRIEGLNAGADEFLSKPIDMSELQARVRAGLRLYQLNQDLQAQTEHLTAELAEGAAYVGSILPVPWQEPLRIEARFIPCRQLGGDSFDYHWLTTESIALYLLDVSGHGLGAALPAVSIVNLLRSQALSGLNYEDPQAVLQALNQTFPINEQHRRYLTIWYGVYHLGRQELTYASAGHPPALLVSPQGQKPSSITPLKTPGLPIGLFEEADYATQRCFIAADSALYLFSDGIYEIEQPNQQIIGLEQFTELIHDLHQQGLASLDEIISTVQSRAAQPGFKDDLSLLQVLF